MEHQTGFVCQKGYIKAVPYPLRCSIVKRKMYFEKLIRRPKRLLWRSASWKEGYPRPGVRQRRGFNNITLKDKAANEKYGSKINSKKTKVLKTNLGSWVYQDGNCTRDILRWLVITMQTLQNLNPLWKRSRKHDKLGVLRAFPATTYGCVS